MKLQRWWVWDDRSELFCGELNSRWLRWFHWDGKEKLRNIWKWLRFSCLRFGTRGWGDHHEANPSTLSCRRGLVKRCRLPCWRVSRIKPEHWLPNLCWRGWKLSELCSGTKFPLCLLAQFLRSSGLQGNPKRICYWGRFQRLRDRRWSSSFRRRWDWHR